MHSIKLMYENNDVAIVNKDLSLTYLCNTHYIESLMDFIIDRVPSRSRRDIEKILFKLGLNEYDEFKLAIKTHLINPMDKYWLKTEEKDEYYSLLRNHLMTPREEYSPSGNNIKKYYWLNGIFGLAKKRLAPVITDLESEVACYRLSKLFNIGCCYTEQLDRDWSFSKYHYDFNKDEFRHVRRDMIKPYSGNLYEDLLKSFPDLEFNINQLILFDFLTRQDDRHRSNIATLYSHNKRSLYPLYDNGRSLFFEDSEDFIKRAVKDIELYSTTFGEIGTYFDIVSALSGIKKYINLNVTELDIRKCFMGLSMSPQKIEGCVTWITNCIKLLQYK